MVRVPYIILVRCIESFHWNMQTRIRLEGKLMDK